MIVHHSEGQQARGKMVEVPRFALLERAIDDFIDEQVNKNTRAKTDGDINLLKPFLQRKVELRNVEEMTQ